MDEKLQDKCLQQPCFANDPCVIWRDRTRRAEIGRGRQKSDEILAPVAGLLTNTNTTVARLFTNTIVAKMGLHLIKLNGSENRRIL